MEKLVELIVDKYDGSLKAEHGTGRNMAPFVEREWGEKATELMWRIKELADPTACSARACILNRDPGCTCENLKTTPQIEEEVDHLRRVRLLRAGLPEPRPDDDAAPADRPAPRDGAPAGGLAGAARRCSASTSTTRSRPAPPTAPARSPARSGSTPASSSRSCARAQHAEREERVALRLAKRWAPVERAARAGLRAGDAPAGSASAAMRGASRAARAGGQRASSCPSGRRHAAARRRRAAGDRAARARRPSTCPRASTGSSAARATAPAARAPSLPEALVAVSRAPACRSGSRPTSPGHCCATPWTLEGLRGAARGGWPTTRSTRCWRWSDGGALPVVIDATSCTHGLGASRPTRC